MSVLPWPGVRACPAPRAIARRIEPRATSGVRSATRKRSGISPPTPPGTAAPSGAAGEGVPTGAPAGAVPAGGEGRAPDAPAPEPRGGEGPRAEVEGRGQERFRVARQAGGDIGRGGCRRARGGGDRHAIADDDDLAPADPLAVRGGTAPDRH